jgi:hypothetical protein
VSAQNPALGWEPPDTLRGSGGHLVPIGMAGAFAPFAGWPERLSNTSHPAATGSAHSAMPPRYIQRFRASIDHHVDKVLRLVLRLAFNNCEKYLMSRIGDREVHPAL